MIERSQFGQIGSKERCAVKFSETADFLEKSVPVGGVSATVSDSKVNKFLHALKSPLSIVTAAFGEPFCGAVTFTSDVRHLLGKCHFSPSSVTESFVLHGYSTNLETISRICLRMPSSSTSRLRLPCQARIFIREIKFDEIFSCLIGI